MLPKRQRLKRASFAEVSRGGKRLFSPYFSVVFKKNQENKSCDFAVVISKKVAKNATTRNLIRRRMYHILSELDRSFDNKMDNVFSIIFYLKDEKVVKEPFSVLKKEIASFLAKIRG